MESSFLIRLWSSSGLRIGLWLYKLNERQCRCLHLQRWDHGELKLYNKSIREYCGREWFQLNKFQSWVVNTVESRTWMLSGPPDCSLDGHQWPNTLSETMITVIYHMTDNLFCRQMSHDVLLQICENSRCLKQWKRNRSYITVSFVCNVYKTCCDYNVRNTMSICRNRLLASRKVCLTWRKNILSS